MTHKINNQDELIEDVKARQENTVWPDTLKNGSSVDAFLWRGDPDAPLVQRMGAWIFGITFILGGLGWLGAAFQRHWPVFGLLSTFWFFIGGKVFLNGFRKHSKVHSKK